MKWSSVQGGNDGLGCFVGYFYKAKAAALIGLTVESDAGTDDFGERLDEFSQLGSRGCKGQVTKIQYFAHIPKLSMPAVYSFCAGCASQALWRRSRSPLYSVR